MTHDMLAVVQTLMLSAWPPSVMARLLRIETYLIGRMCR